VSDFACKLSDLKDRPDFRAAVADRVWRAWWVSKGVTLDYIDGLVCENLNETGFPFAIVAHDGETFLGTASVIASDLEERPNYTPWVAAVWVDPQHRKKGVGAAIVRQAAAQAFERGFETVYLCALPEKSGFYEQLGWRLLERDVGEHRLNVLTSTKL